jgi:hypothetical protein
VSELRAVLLADWQLLALVCALSSNEQKQKPKKRPKPKPKSKPIWALYIVYSANSKALAKASSQQLPAGAAELLAAEL